MWMDQCSVAKRSIAPWEGGKVTRDAHGRSLISAPELRLQNRSGKVRVECRTLAPEGKNILRRDSAAAARRGPGAACVCPFIMTPARHVHVVSCLGSFQGTVIL